jgi:hypothetical protein
MHSSSVIRAGLFVLALLAVSACSTPPKTADQDEQPTKYYRTGSHIPMKDTDGGYAKSQDVQSVQDEMRRSSGVGPLPSGK